MKKHNFVRIGLMVLAAMTVSACSPFGNQSLIQDISKEIGVFIPGKTSTSVISSASSTQSVPDPANGPAGQQPYGVTHSVGDAYQQPTFRAQDATNTPSGYTVFSSVSGDIK
ncbi:hypothetical protein [Pseudobdellovibrio sp. HCB154]|uniref:hypothetical protein n=1 Tax=Pseudobdellovibrio sp. HCB154 TaxID=3386277 RepID=UPI0039174FC5